MKKIVLVLSFIASAFVLVGCSNTTGGCAQPEAAPAPVHHDYKGEVSK
jgi:PBP1b-binding outer membrane lipoprotein LpoB